MKISKNLIPFIQAGGLTIYVALFATVAQYVNTWLKPTSLDPVISIVLFLLAFVISAIIAGALILGYPLYLFFENRKKEAVKILCQSALWLIFFLALFLIVAFVL